MRIAKIVAVALVCFGIWVVLTTGVIAVWLTGEIRVVALVALPTAIVAPLLVVYFEWRETRRRRMLGDPEDDRKAA